MDLYAENEEIPIIVQAKLPIQEGVQNVKQKNLLPQEPSFIIVNSLLAKLFTLPTLFVKAKKTYLHMSLHDGYHYGR